eukprot:jgi/Ulvmu1/11805/UM080_0016.1
MGWKRLSIVTWVVAYIAFVGVPVWWRTTSIERPVFPPNTKRFFQSLPDSISDLPVTFHVSIVATDVPDGACSPEISQASSGEDTGDAGREQGRQCSFSPVDLEGVRFQLQQELDAAATATAAVLHVDSMHVLSPDCTPAPPQATESSAACSQRVSVPCAARQLLGPPPPFDPAAPASTARHSDTAAFPPVSDAAAHVRQLQQAIEAGGAPVCPGTHHILLIVGTDSSGRARSTQGTPAAAEPAVWIGSGRTSFVWLPGPDLASPLRGAIGKVFGAVMHGLHASDLQTAPQAAGPEDGGVAPGPPGGTGAAEMERRKLPVSAASELSAVFTLAVAEPRPASLPDGIGHAIEAAWGPLVQRLAPLADVRLESQARLFARARLVSVPVPPAAADGVSPGVTLPPEALPFFVDSDAWALEHGRMIAGHAHPLSPDPHGIPENVLHFVGYLPPAAERPMRVRCGAALCAGFQIAGWGGVTIMNADDYRRDVPLFLGTAMQQFREVLGLTPAGDWRVACDRAAGGEGVHLVRVAVLSPASDGVALWEVDGLLRRRYRQLLNETGAAVTALLDLVATLESLEIPAFIGTKVESAGLRTREAVHAGGEGDYQFAVKQARAARVDAEVALTHHAIASQHSFPFQHKIAVYLPLFAPLSLPIMAAVFVEVRHRLGKE